MNGGYKTMAEHIFRRLLIQRINEKISQYCDIWINLGVFVIKICGSLLEHRCQHLTESTPKSFIRVSIEGDKFNLNLLST